MVMIKPEAFIFRKYNFFIKIFLINSCIYLLVQCGIQYTLYNDHLPQGFVISSLLAIWKQAINCCNHCYLTALSGPLEVTQLSSSPILRRTSFCSLSSVLPRLCNHCPAPGFLDINFFFFLRKKEKYFQRFSALPPFYNNNNKNHLPVYLKEKHVTSVWHGMPRSEDSFWDSVLPFHHVVYQGLNSELQAWQQVLLPPVSYQLFGCSIIGEKGTGLYRMSGFFLLSTWIYLFCLT